MAESDVKSYQIKNVEGGKKEKLRYLEIVHVAAMQALVCISRLYDLAKENSGPLRPGVQTVEGTVKSVVGPVYEKFHDVPLDILKFVDDKIGYALEEVDRHMPSLVKEASTQAYSAAQRAPEVAREVREAGLVNTATGLARAAYTKAEPTAKTLYTKYEPVAEQYAVSSWRSLNSLPGFPQVAEIIVPTASYWANKYNKAVAYTAKKGYSFSAYLPVVPTKRIAKAFREENRGGVKAAAATE